MEKLMFEAADPDVFAWYIKNYGADVNLFVDHSQIVQLECLRAGICTNNDEARMTNDERKSECSNDEGRASKTRVILSEAQRSRRIPG
jgi:phosphosulfolactate synthase (CoM biosynthesis protein A)